MKERLLLWLAISGGAILLERATDRATSATSYYEDPEDDNRMLRKKQNDDGS